MSAFADLIRDADNLGVSKLVWECDVRGWAKDPQRDDRWTCRATALDPFACCGEGIGPVQSAVYEARGRTGEEALRFVVDFLRRTE